MLKDLLVAELVRAANLLSNKDRPFDYDADNIGDAPELKRLMLSIRKHSIQMEKEAKKQWDR